MPLLDYYYYAMYFVLNFLMVDTRFEILAILKYSFKTASKLLAELSK